MRTSRFFRLCSRAPLMWMWVAACMGRTRNLPKCRQGQSRNRFKFGRPVRRECETPEIRKSLAGFCPDFRSSALATRFPFRSSLLHHFRTLRFLSARILAWLVIPPPVSSGKTPWLETLSFLRTPMNESPSSSRLGRIAGACLFAASLSLLTVPSLAFEFSSGEVKGSFDSTFSIGALYRLDGPSAAYYGTSNTFNGVPGQQTSVNTDDGNLNYGAGLVSALFKGSHDLELHYRNFGLLARGYYFKDTSSNDTARTPLSDQARDRVVQGAEILDL